MRVCYAAVLALVLAREGRAAPILLPPSDDDLLAFSTLKPWLPVLPPPLNDTAAKPAPNGTTQHEADLSAAAELEKRCARLKKRGLFDCDEKAKAKTAKKKADKLRAKIEKFKANRRRYCADRSYGIMKMVESQESRLVKCTEDIATCKKWFADTDKDDKGKRDKRVESPVPAICMNTDGMIRDKERLPLEIKKLRTELGRPCPSFLD